MTVVAVEAVSSAGTSGWAVMRERVLTGLLREEGALASRIGYLAFPGKRFRSPQGAALAASRLTHTLLAEKLIALHVFRSGSYEYRLTEAGRRAAALIQTP